MSGDKITFKENHTLFEQTALTTDLSRCANGRIHEFKGQMYKLPEFYESCITLSPFALLLFKNANGKMGISTRVSWLLYPENTVGIELRHPKKFQGDLSDSEVKEMLLGKNELPSYRDYLLLKESIWSITKPLSFQAEGQLIKPGVLVSEDALRELPKLYFSGVILLKKYAGQK